MSTIEERLRDAIRANYDEAEVTVDNDPELISYSIDQYGVYWVDAQVAISPMDLDPNPNPVYSVWECEDFSEEHDWSDVSDWRPDERYQSESDDGTGTNVRKQAHDRAKYLRSGDSKGARGVLYAVRPGHEPPPLLPVAKGHPRPGSSRLNP